MSVYYVDVQQTVHTCPADATLHVVDVRRTIIGVVDGGPCRNPITIRSGDTIATVNCGRQLPAPQQCPACRTTVVEHSVTTIDIGEYIKTPGVATGGLAARPCAACGQPLAAILADWRTHLLCAAPAHTAATPITTPNRAEVTG